MHITQNVNLQSIIIIYRFYALRSIFKVLVHSLKIGH